MKVYNFAFYINDFLFRPTVYEAELDGNSYNLTLEEERYSETITIPKTRIGQVTGKGNPWSVYLLEDDFVKARTLILDFAEKDEQYTYIVEQIKKCIDIYDQARNCTKEKENL